MSGYGVRPAAIHSLNVPSSFMPPSQFENQVGPQMLPDAAFFDNITTSVTHMFPEPLPDRAQLPLTTSQRGQKRNFLDMEYIENAGPVLQHCDPTFYGLSASLPMSTYATPLSLPPAQSPSRSTKQATQHTQGFARPMQRRTQASHSYTGRPAASARPRAACGSQPTPSRRLYGPSEQYRTTRPQQQPGSSTFMRSTPPTTYDASDHPRSWNWLNDFRATGMPLDMPGPVYHNFTFTWPTPGGEPQTMMHLHNTQGPGLMHPISTQAVAPEWAANTSPSYPNTGAFRAFHSLQATPETRTDSFGYVGAPVEENRAIDVPFGPQGPLTSWVGQRLSPPLQCGVPEKDLDIQLASVNALPDFPGLDDFDSAMFANLASLDYDFGIDSDFAGNIGGDSKTPSDTGDPARDPHTESLTQEMNNSNAADSADESALLELLQPVVSYLASCSNSPQSATDDRISRAVSVSARADLPPIICEPSTTGVDSSSFGARECQSAGDMCFGITETPSNVVDEPTPIDSPARGKTPTASGTSGASPTTKSEACGGAAISLQSAFPNKTWGWPPLADAGFNHDSLRAESTISATDTSQPTAIVSIASTTDHTAAPVRPGMFLSATVLGSVDFRQQRSCHYLHSTQPPGSPTESSSDTCHDVHRWLDIPCSPYVGEPGTMAFEALPILEGREIDDSWVPSGNEWSQLDASRSEPLTPIDDAQLRVMRRRLAISHVHYDAI